MLQPKDFTVLWAKKKYVAVFERGSKNWRVNKFVGLSTKYDVTRHFSRGDFELNFGSFNKVFTPKLTGIPKIYKTTPFLSPLQPTLPVKLLKKKIERTCHTFLSFENVDK